MKTNTDIKNIPRIEFKSELNEIENIEKENKSKRRLLKCNICGTQSESKTKLQSHVCLSNGLFGKECGFLAESTLTWKSNNEYSH